MARLRYLQNKRSGAAGTISKSTNRIYFFDDNAYIYAASSGVLHIVATTINLDGAFTFTGTDKLNLGTSGTPLTLTAGTPVMTVYTTCSGAVGTVAQPILFNTVLTGAGQLGGRVRVNMATEVTLGSYANAFKASVDLGTNGGVTGLLSVVCSEMTMATANISGTYAIEEWEMTYAATGSGSLPKPCFVYANTNGTARTVFDDYGDFIIFGTGFTSATGHMFGAGTSTIRLGTGALGGTKRYIPLSTAEASFTTAYPIVSSSTAALTISGTASADHIAITGKWSTSLTTSAISIGDYSTALAFGAISEHVLGIVSHISADFDDASNVISILGKVTLEGDSDSAVAQCIYGQGVCNYNIADMYGIRGAITISGAPEVNQIFSVFGSMTTTACNVATTGAIALFGGTITGSADITRTGATAVMCGMYLNWNVTTVSMTIPVYGVMVNINASAYVDYGIIVHGGYCNEAAFCSSGTSHDVAFEVKDAHTYAFKFPAIATAPCSAYTTEEAPTGKIKIRVGTAVRYLAYWD